jgi:hypothetical protein
MTERKLVDLVVYSLFGDDQYWLLVRNPHRLEIGISVGGSFMPLALAFAR